MIASRNTGGNTPGCDKFFLYIEFKNSFCYDKIQCGGKRRCGQKSVFVYRSYF